MRTGLADNLVREFAAEMVLDGLLLGSAFDCGFEFVHEHCEVLFDVHLLIDVDWLALPVLECVAVSLWVDIHLLREEKAREEGLPLEEHVVLVCVVVMVWVLDRQNVVAEAGDHKELLIERIHVANAA